MTEFAKWRRRRCKQMAFNRKNIIFNANSKHHLPFLLVFCYLASGTYDTPNSFGNTCIQALYVVLRQSSPNFLLNAFQTIGIFNLRYRCCTRFFFIVLQTISIMLRSGLWAGHGKVPMELSRSHSFALTDT